jgi:hypothetical protein
VRKSRTFHYGPKARPAFQGKNREADIQWLIRLGLMLLAVRLILQRPRHPQMHRKQVLQGI